MKKSIGDKLLWKYLLKEGKVLVEQNYYGNTYDRNLTEKLRIKADEGTLDVDWDRTSSVTDSLCDKFRGTFHDNPPVNCLKGELHLYSGGVHNFYKELGDMKFTEVVQEVLGEG